MSAYSQAQNDLKATPHTWLVTGGAGFIGSHLTEKLVALGQNVKVLDNLSSGDQAHLAGLNQEHLHFIEGDICDFETCQRACEGVDFILHHAAIGSVVKSIEEPELVDRVNRGGFENILQAAKEHDVQRVIYAGSSAIYGDGDANPRREDETPQPKSPYAEGKLGNETAAKSSTLDTIGLRYFNIYGPRQDPEGDYAAVIPKWIQALERGEQIKIFGDGKTVRDFAHVHDAVQANILAACSDKAEIIDQIYNVAAGQGTDLNQLFGILKNHTGTAHEPAYEDFRVGDIRISQADITKIQNALGFEPTMNLEDGLKSLIQYQKDAA